MNRAILVDIIDPKTSDSESLDRLNELESLLSTYGGFVIIRTIQKKQTPNYRTYIGSGKVDEIKKVALEKNANFIIINNSLKPEQLYNLEYIFEKHKIKVWDKIDLILEIFAKHADTKEAKLQIELAKLKHLGPRISKMGLELMRQGGGIGTRGQGETNIEIMKRHIQTKEQNIKKQLKKIETNQRSQRISRKNHGFKTVAIIGYTNAGKSQLLNSLTKKNIKIKNELFATLDSRIGKTYLPDSNELVLLSDTIGFIKNIPHSLIDAFHSTLSETINADLLLHVIDIDDLNRDSKIDLVNKVLIKLNCQNKKVIYVFNKIDNLQHEKDVNELTTKYKKYKPVFISAKKKINLNELKSKISKELIK